MKCGNEYSIASASTPMGSGCFVRVKPGNPVVKPPKFPPLPAVLHPDRIPKWVTTHVSDPRQIMFLQATAEGWPVQPVRWAEFERSTMLFRLDDARIRQLCASEQECTEVYSLFKRVGWWPEWDFGLVKACHPEHFKLEVIPPPAEWFSQISEPPSPTLSS